MSYKKPIGDFKHRVTVHHLQEKIDEIGTPVEQWIPVHTIWVALKPTHNYRQNKDNIAFQQIANPHYQMTARSGIFYCDTNGNLKNIWNTTFRLRYKDSFLKPLVYPSIDPSKQSISVILQYCFHQ